MKIVGDYHTHTNFSDGETTVFDIVRAAKERGLAEIAISDHGFKKFPGGLRKSGFDRYIGDIESARSEMPVLVGVEANLVATDGSIDVTDEMNKRFDIVLFGIHMLVVHSIPAFFSYWIPNMFYKTIRFTPKHRRARNTEIVKRVIQNNRIDIWAHPNRYFKLDVVEVARTCVARGTLIELNSKKISFRPIDFERMQSLGAKFIIGSDAHTTKKVGDFTRVEEFLKNCDYNPKNIINLNKTYTEYKNEQISGTNKVGSTTPDSKPKERKGFFHRK